MSAGPLFRDRRHAGRVLAGKLGRYRDQDDVVVLALPRGGVAVGFEVARALQAPLDVFVVRKLGFPGHEEYAMGAIASGGVQVMNPDAGPGVSALALREALEREGTELARRERAYREGRPLVPVRGKTVIVVDDGIATGATMRAAVIAVRLLHPAHLAVAAPVGARAACHDLRALADDVVCAQTPEPFGAVGRYYADFPQAVGGEVRALLEEARAPLGA